MKLRDQVTHKQRDSGAPRSPRYPDLTLKSPPNWTLLEQQHANLARSLQPEERELCSQLWRRPHSRLSASFDPAGGSHLSPNGTSDTRFLTKAKIKRHASIED